MQTLFGFELRSQENLGRKIELHKIFLTFSIFAFLILSSCAVKKPFSPIDPLAVLGSQCNMYFVIPVIQNKPLISQIISNMDDADSLKSALDRTELLYAGLCNEQNTERYTSLLAFGSYPKAVSSILFSHKKGWKKNTEKNIGTWYSSDLLEASIPENGIMLASTSGALRSLLATRFTPEPSNVSTGFSVFAQNAREDGRIGLYLNDPSFLVQLIFGSEIIFPIEFVEIYATPPTAQIENKPKGTETALCNDSTRDESAYVIYAHVELQNERSARVFASILRLTLGVSSVQNDSSVIISEFQVKQQSLVDLAQKMYFLH